MVNKALNTLGFRPTPNDAKLIAWLKIRLGLGFSQVVRLALRVLAAKEGVK